MRIVRKHGTPLLLLFVGLALGFFLSAHWVPNVSAVGRQDYESLEAFSNILSIVKKNYVEDVETKSLVSGAINGMLNSLDPHSAYLTPELYKELQSDTQVRMAAAATLSLTPATGTFNRSCNFSIAVDVDTTGTQTDGTDAIVLYDPRTMTTSYIYFSLHH